MFPFIIITESSKTCLLYNTFYYHYLKTIHKKIIVQVSVTARDDVPFFGPTLPDPAIFKKVSWKNLWKHATCFFLICFLNSSALNRDLWSVSLLGTRVPWVFIYKAHQCRTRLLQSWEVCQTGGELIVFKAMNLILPVFFFTHIRIMLKLLKIYIYCIQISVYHSIILICIAKHPFKKKIFLR